MSTFSNFALFTAGLAALAPLASAYTQPKGDTPSGNAISLPGLNDVVPAGKVYTITWNPTTSGKVSLLLCKGPSTNCVITATLADSIENSGTYAWTPSTDLEPSQPTGYGIELVVEGTGEYQYSTQFGISNDAYDGSSSSSSSAVATKSSAAATTSSAVTTAALAVDVDITTNARVVADAATSSAASVISSAVSAASASAASKESASPILSTASAAGTGSVRASSSLSSNSTHFSGWGFANSTDVKATAGSGTVTLASASTLHTSTVSGSHSSTKSSSTSASGSASASKSGSATGTSSGASASATQSGSAGQFGASMGGLAVAFGIAVFAL